MKKILLFITLSIIGLQSFSQSWHQLMYDTNATFYDVQKDFYDEWGDKPYERGRGYKQFKRWEHFMQGRVDENGKLDNSWALDFFKSTPNLPISVAPPIYQSSNSSTPVWELVGPIDVPDRIGGFEGIGRVNCVAFVPSDTNTLYIGTPSGGIWKSIDGGQNWTTTSQFLNSLGVSCLAVDPNNPDVVYAGTGDKDGFNTFTVGLLKSTDAGQTWQTIGLANQHIINDIIINPNNSHNIIVSTQFDTWRTTDGGINWLQASGIASNINDIAFKPNDTNIVYGTRNYGGLFYRSVDNGANWSQVTSGLPPANSAKRGIVSVSPDDPNVVYVAFTNQNNGFYGIYKSIDSGQSFSEQYRCVNPSTSTPNLLDWSVNGDEFGGKGQGFYDFAMTVNPSNVNEVYMGGINIWKSIDGGQNWNLNAYWTGIGYSYVHADIHFLAYQPNSSKLYNCNDGGISVSKDNGSSWDDISDGLSITQYYDLGVSVTDTDKVIMGAQDNGTFLLDSSVITGILGGDGMRCFIDPEDDNIMYASYQQGDLQRTINGGESWQSIRPSAGGAWETPFIMDKADPATLYAGYSQLYKSTDRGDSWSIIAVDTLTQNMNISEIETTSDSNTLYFLVNISTSTNTTPKIYKTTDGGASWNNIAPNTGSLQRFTAIASHNHNPNHIWVSQSNKIWESQDGGVNWTDISSTYSGPHINYILHSSNNKALYIGSDKGVYSSNDSIISWTSFNNSTMPNTIVQRLEIQPITNVIYAATYGRGLWKMKLPVVSVPLANFKLMGDTFSCDGGVDFLDLSHLLPSSWQWDFGDGNTSIQQNPVHTYSQGGQYTVTLTVSNNIGSDSKTINSIVTVMDKDIAVQGASICQNTSTSLSANSNWDVIWYSDSLAQNELDTGLTFTTPTLGASTTYYVKSVKSSQEINSGIDKSITSSVVSYWDNGGLKFNCMTPSTLKSVKVYSNHNLHRRIKLQDANGNILYDTLVYTPNNPNGQIIELGFELPVQNDLILKETQATVWDHYLIANTLPTGGLYPITIGNLITITSNSYGSEYIYNYFYDWVVKEKSCESNITPVNVVVNSAISSTINQTICDGDSYTFGGNTYTNSGTYTNTIPTSSGCDSVVALNLVVSPPANSTFSYSACNDYTWNGTTYNSSGTYTYTTTNSAGCDSTVTLNLTINQPSSSTTSQTACNDYTWNGTSYSSSGTYTYTTTNSAGCDSTATLNLTITQSTTSTTSHSACNEYTWNGTTYSSSGLYTFNTTNSSGCDSTATLNLTIQNGSTWDTISVCNSYTWNGTNYTSSGIYTDVLPCGTATLNLTIKQSSSSAMSQTTCNDYTWNGTTYNSSGTYTYTTTNSVGCDSISTLNLTINSATASTHNQTACDSYSWNGTTYNAFGTYTHTTTNSVGCDSTATLNLIVNPSTSSNSNFASCDSSFTWNGSDYTASGTYTFVTQNSNGCDSTATLALTLVDLSTPSINGSTSVNQTDDFDYDISVQSFGNAVQWGIDNGTINSGQNTNTVNVSWGNASYTGAIWAIETDTNGCLSDTAKLIVNIDPTVSIVENSLLNIKVYPNPFDDYTTVEFDNPQNEQYSIRLIDIRGRLVQQHNTNGKKLVLYKKQLNDGIYYLEVEGRYKAREIIVIQ